MTVLHIFLPMLLISMSAGTKQRPYRQHNRYDPRDRRAVGGAGGGWDTHQEAGQGEWRDVNVPPTRPRYQPWVPRYGRRDECVESGKVDRLRRALAQVREAFGRADQALTSFQQRLDQVGGQRRQRQRPYDGEFIMRGQPYDNQDRSYPQEQWHGNGARSFPQGGQPYDNGEGSYPQEQTNELRDDSYPYSGQQHGNGAQSSPQGWQPYDNGEGSYPQQQTNGFHQESYPQEQTNEIQGESSAQE